MAKKEEGISGSKLLRKIADQLLESVCCLSDEELNALNLAAKRVTTTNCGWFVYDAAFSIKPLTDEEIRDRKCTKANSLKRARGEQL